MICAKCGAEIVGQPVECPNCGKILQCEYDENYKGYRIVKNEFISFVVSLLLILSLLILTVLMIFGPDYILKIESEGLAFLYCVGYFAVVIRMVGFEIFKKKSKTSTFINCIKILTIYEVIVICCCVFIHELMWAVIHGIKTLILVLLTNELSSIIDGEKKKGVAVVLSISLLVCGMFLCFYEYFVPEVIVYLIIMLRILSMSRDENKQYITLPEYDYEDEIECERSIGICIFLSIITLGVYYIYWRYLIIRDIRRLNEKDDDCIGECLLVLFVPLYDWYWLYTRANKLSVIGINNGVNATGGGFVFVFFDIIGFGWINVVMMQTTLNELSQVMSDDFVYGDVIQNKQQVVVKNEKDDRVSLIYDLKKMKEDGIITEEEFEAKKSEILSKM